MFVHIIAVLMLIVSVIIWAIASSTGNAHTAAKARLGAWSLSGPLLLPEPGSRGSTCSSAWANAGDHRGADP